jgi:curved DNA-binding protein CbpA
MVLANKDIDYYELLLVSRNAPVEVIRASYRTLMQKLKHHPDLGGDAATAALINEAYAALCDTKRRAEHDAYLEAVKLADQEIDVGAPRSAPAPSAPETQNPYRECVFCGTTHQQGMTIVEDTTCIACSSPLFPADNLRLELTGQRAVTRIDKSQEIVFFTQWPQAAGFSGQTEDISLNGMRFVTQASMAQGQYIKIVSEIAEAVAQVSNFSRRRRGLSITNVAGVAFVTLRFRQSLGGFVSERI